jgi:ribosome-associated heat shock protein Hsp15
VTDPERSRLDRWLWSVRLTKTRSEATDACRAGHVRLNGRPAKAAHTVASGDRVEARLHGRERIVEVVRPIENRVGAPTAVECYVDHSPPPPSKDDLGILSERDRGAGRPTKRDRRQIEAWRSRNR